MGLILGLGSSLLGYGKVLLSWLLDMIKVIFQFALNKPFQFLTIVLAAMLLWAGWYAVDTKQQLVETQKIVEDKVTYIKGQDKVLKEYVKSLEIEKTNHVRDITRSNSAVANIKKTADAALARAQAAGQAARKDQAKFDKMGADYGRSNVSTGKPEERIKREEATNDSFIKEWRKIK